MKVQPEDILTVDVTENQLASIVETIQISSAYSIGGRVRQSYVYKKVDVERKIVDQVLAYLAMNGYLKIKFVFIDPETGEVSPEYDSTSDLRENVDCENIYSHMGVSFYLPE